jgi:uroporphyrinogen decarboxylase
MSRADAVAALRDRRSPESSQLVTALGWLSPGLLGEIAMEAGGGDSADAMAIAAAAVAVDAAFVSAREPDSGDLVAALHAADVAAIWTVDGVFARVAEAIGWTEALRMTAIDPGVITARLDEALGDAIVVTRRALQVGADAVLVADDLFGAAGPLISPDFALDALVPCYHRLVLEAEGSGLPTVFHSDGDIRALMPALARAGFSAVHLAVEDVGAFTASAMAARRSGLVPLGGIAARSLVDGAREAGEHAAATAASLGGVIVGDDGGLSALVEFTAFGAALEVAREAFLRIRG